MRTITEYDKVTINLFEKALNFFLKKNFDWFKKIELDQLIFNSGFNRQSHIVLVGEIYVDSEWAHKQWREYHYDSFFPGDEKLSFGNIIGGKESKELQDIFNEKFQLITGNRSGHLSWSWLDVKIVESDENYLQEQISRIKSMIGESETSRMTKYIYGKFDNLFDKLKLEKTYEDIHHYSWFHNENGKKVFERNHWGRCWVYDCDEYRELLLVGKLFGITYREFENILIEYLNERYKYEFGDRPLKDIADEGCYDTY